MKKQKPTFAPSRLNLSEGTITLTFDNESTPKMARIIKNFVESNLLYTIEQDEKNICVITIRKFYQLRWGLFICLVKGFLASHKNFYTDFTPPLPIQLKALDVLEEFCTLYLLDGPMRHTFQDVLRKYYIHNMKEQSLLSDVFSAMLIILGQFGLSPLTDTKLLSVINTLKKQYLTKDGEK